IESKTNRDQVIEFFYLVGMADDEKSLVDKRHEIDDLVVNVVKNPHDDGVIKNAVSQMKEYFDDLPKSVDPREKSSKIAAAWKKSNRLKEGTEARKKGEAFLSTTSSSNSETDTPSRPDYALRVDVRQEKNLKEVKYAIRCFVPGRAQHGQVENIVRYAASTGMVYQVGDSGELKHFNGSLSIARRAVFYSKKSWTDWNYIEGSTRISEVEGTKSLQLINTNSEHFALAAACSMTVQDPPPDLKLLALPDPRKIEKYLRNTSSKYRDLRRAIERSEHQNNLPPLIQSLMTNRFAIIQLLPPRSVPGAYPQSPASSGSLAPISVHPHSSASLIIDLQSPNSSTSFSALSPSPSSSSFSSIIPQFPSPPQNIPEPLVKFPLPISPGTGPSMLPPPTTEFNGTSMPPPPPPATEFNGTSMPEPTTTEFNGTSLLRSTSGRTRLTRRFTINTIEEESRSSSPAPSWHTAEDDPGQPWADSYPDEMVDRGVQDDEQAPVSDPHFGLGLPEPNQTDDSGAAQVADLSVEDSVSPTMASHPVPDPSSNQQASLSGLNHLGPNQADSSGEALVVDLSGEDSVSPTGTSRPTSDPSSTGATSFTPDDLHENTTGGGWALVQAPLAPCSTPPSLRRPSIPLPSVTQAVAASPEISRPSLNSPSNSSLPSQISSTGSGKKKKPGILQRVVKLLGLSK
ncbi:hypothetical protein FRC01_009486, partial [Tulasnella sp. 417]